MGDSAAERTLKKYYSYHKADQEEVYRALEKESDRATVIILGSMLEQVLIQEMHARHLPAVARDDLDTVFGTNGPLSSFSSKIVVSSAMGLIEPKTADQLQTMRSLRNACAHSAMPLDFSTAELTNVALRLFRADVAPFYPLTKEQEKGAELRAACINECVAISLAIMEDRDRTRADLARLMDDDANDSEDD